MSTFKKLTVAVLSFIALAGISLADEGWMTSIEDAVAKAKTEKKQVMVEFTGSDWCPPCIRMHKEVFSKEEFVKQASEKFILVKIDIPRRDKELTAKNQPILQKYKVQGVPTVIVLDKEGAELDRFVASKFPSVEGFLEQLNKSAEKGSKS